MATKARAPRRKLISAADAAAETGVSAKTIVRMIEAGDVPGYRVGKRGVYRIDERDLVIARRVVPGARR